MDKILITGSLGLIGRTLTQFLENNTSYILKGLDTRYDMDDPRYGDINNIKRLEQSIHDVDGIVHLAGVSRVIFGQKNPEKCWQTNVTATQNLLKFAKKSARNPWVIYASSREVYGQQKCLPVTEAATRSPLNIYAKSKVAAEDCVTHAQESGVPAIILRFSSVYGAVDDHETRVIPAFVRAALLNNPINVEGEKTTLDFTHVSDVVYGIYRVIQHLMDRKQLPTIHFTSGKPVTLLELAHVVMKITKSQSVINSFPGRDFDVERFVGNPTRANKLLNWTPKIDLNQGIERLAFEYLKKKRPHENIKSNSRISSDI